MNKDKTTDSVNESGFKRTGRRLKIKLSNANRANIEGAKNAILRRETRLVRTGHDRHIYRPPAPRTPPKNRDRTIADSFNHGLDEGERRYERLLRADIKKHGYTELPGRSDPKRAAVFNANTRKIARERRLAGIVPGSANARPENRSDVLIHSARKSAEKRIAGKPAPRIAPKNRKRKIAEAKKPAATKMITPPKGLRATIRDHKPSTLVGSAIHGATVRTMDHNLAPAGRGRIRHALGGAVRGIAQHVLNSLLSSKRK